MYLPYLKLILLSLAYISNLVQRHSVELDSFCILSKLEINVAHVDLETTSIVKHPVFGDYLNYKNRVNFKNPKANV